MHPVEHNVTILNFAKNYNKAYCGDRIILIVNCMASLTTTFCREQQNTACAQQLHTGEVEQCATLHVENLVLPSKEFQHMSRPAAKSSDLYCCFS